MGYIDFSIIAEEILGDMDVNTGLKMVTKLGKNRYLIDADIDLEELEETLNIDFPDVDYETLNGFLIYKLERIPEKDEKYKYKKLEFTISEVTNKSIEKVILTIGKK